MTEVVDEGMAELFSHTETSHKLRLLTLQGCFRGLPHSHAEKLPRNSEWIFRVERRIYSLWANNAVSHKCGSDPNAVQASNGMLVDGIS